MKPVLILFLLSLTTACASQKLYLFSRYIKPSELQVLEKELELIGYDVESNKHYFPSNVQENTLVHSFHYDQNEVNKLLQIAAKLGFSTVNDQLYSIAGKHIFTNNSLGLYLFPKEQLTSKDNVIVKSDDTYNQDLVGEFESSWECARYLSIELFANDSFVQEISPWSDESKEADYLGEKVIGKWSLSANKVTLIYDNKQKFAFKVTRHKTMDGGYMRHTTKLTPEVHMEAGLQSCELKMNLMEYINI
jgi:hypothetical protein